MRRSRFALSYLVATLYAEVDRQSLDLDAKAMGQLRAHEAGEGTTYDEYVFTHRQACAVNSVLAAMESDALLAAARAAYEAYHAIGTDLEALLDVVRAFAGVVDE